MKSILVIGSGEYQLIGIKKLKEKGFHVISVDGNNNAIGKKYSDIFYHVDIKDVNKIISIILEKNHELITVISFSSEIALNTVATLNEKFNLPGISQNSVNIALNKVKQRDLISANCLNYPKYFNYRKNFSDESVEEFVAKSNISYPVIVKPLDSSGTRGISIVNKKEELIHSAINALNYSVKLKGIIVEEFLYGQEYTVESFVNKYEVYTLAISEKIKNFNNPLISSEIFYNSPRANMHKEKLVEITNKFIDKSKYNNSIVHTEIIHNYRNNKFYIVESSPRGGGFGIFDEVLPKTTELDVVGLFIDSYLGRKVDIKKIAYNPCILGFLLRNPGKISKIDINYSIISKLSNVKYKLLVKEGDIINPLKVDGDRIGTILSYSKDWKEAFAQYALCNYAINFNII